MYIEEKKKVIQAGITLHNYRLISLSGGNVSLRIGKHVLVTPSGMTYEELVPEDIVVVDTEGTVIEGTRRPSVDTEALLYILRELPEMTAVIHTHQPYATAVGLIADELPAAVMPLLNATKGPVTVAPYSSSASITMGIKAVENLKGSLAVILKHHGVVTVGATLKEALYAAVYLEDSAKTYCIARSASLDIPVLTGPQLKQAVEGFNDYGQK